MSENEVTVHLYHLKMTEKTIGLISLVNIHHAQCSSMGRSKPEGVMGRLILEKVQDVSIEELREAAVH